jgi:CubicO group peptidase (beta-lactamase class C family)
MILLALRKLCGISLLLLASSGLLLAQAAGLATETPVEAMLSVAPLNAMEKAVRAGEFKKIGSVVILRHGKLAYEVYFDGDAGTPRDTRSATKSITSTLVGIALDEHRIASVSAPVLSFFPGRKVQNPDPRKSKMSVEDLLTMSSPLECDDWNEFSRGNEERMYVVEDWAQFFLDLPIYGGMRTPGEPVEPPHGRRFSYCTAGVFTLSPILERATGVSADQYAQQKLFSPLGIHSAQWVYTSLDIPQTGGGLRLASRDLAKIAQLYLSGGVWRGQRIVSEDWVKRSITPQTRIDETTEYGYLWWLKSFRSKGGDKYPAFYMSGNGGNKVLGFWSLDMVVVITSTNYNTHGMHEQTEKMLTDYILPAAQPSTASPPDKSD